MSSVQIFVDVFGYDGLPHTFIKVTHPDGSVEEFGLVPKTGGSWIGAGNIDITGPATDHGSHEFTLSMTPRELTNDQYANLMQFINTSILHPPDYYVAGDWAARGYNNSSF